MTILESLVSQGLIGSNVPLGPMTTYKLGGPARYFADVADRDTLRRLVESGVAVDIPVLVLGRGSNLVVADAGFPGLVIRLGAGFNSVRFDHAQPAVTAGGAAPLPKLARSAVEEGLTGLEFFVGIPGSVGGAVRQNAGCFGMETRDRLQWAEVMNLQTGETPKATPLELDLSYRHSNLTSKDLVLEAHFTLERGDTRAAQAEMRRITRWRRDHQPGGTLNAGSVFKNPEHISAGELIDTLGLKGMRSGDVRVSDKHANFFIAGPEATSADIVRLVEAVKSRVFELSGTMLETEVQFVGFEE